MSEEEEEKEELKEELYLRLETPRRRRDIKERFRGWM
jgi:PHD/YefM family antitoxin component YafN of YafNO toxin-antitoxin module